MFGLRYHVASLAAVFVALAVGILLGVAVSGRVTDASEGLEEENLRNDNQRLQQDLEAARSAGLDYEAIGRPSRAGAIAGVVAQRAAE